MNEWYNSYLNPSFILSNSCLLFYVYEKQNCSFNIVTELQECSLSLQWSIIDFTQNQCGYSTSNQNKTQKHLVFIILNPMSTVRVMAESLWSFGFWYRNLHRLTCFLNSARLLSSQCAKYKFTVLKYAKKGNGPLRGLNTIHKDKRRQKE